MKTSKSRDRLFERVARANGTTTAEVKRELETAIDFAYLPGLPCFQHFARRPTPMEFVIYQASMARARVGTGKISAVR